MSHQVSSYPFPECAACTFPSKGACTVSADFKSCSNTKVNNKGNYIAAYQYTDCSPSGFRKLNPNEMSAAAVACNESNALIVGVDLSRGPDMVGISSEEYKRLKKCEQENKQLKDALAMAKEALELILKKHTDLSRHNNYPRSTTICRETLQLIAEAMRNER